MGILNIGEWVIAHWDSLAAFGMLAAGFAFAWKRQLGRSLLCFLGCFGIYVLGG